MVSMVEAALEGAPAGDRRCRFPGCIQDRFVDTHHIRFWARGGETSLANPVKLCRFHHRLLHEGGYRMERDAGGGLRFWRPDGRPLRPQGRWSGRTDRPSWT